MKPIQEMYLSKVIPIMRKVIGDLWDADGLDG